MRARPGRVLRETSTDYPSSHSRAVGREVRCLTNQPLSSYLEPWRRMAKSALQSVVSRKARSNCLAQLSSPEEQQATKPRRCLPRQFAHLISHAFAQIRRRRLWVFVTAGSRISTPSSCQ